MLYLIFKSLLLPPGVIILLLLSAFLLVRGVLGRMILFVALVGLTLMSVPVVAGKLMEGLEVYPAITADRPAPTDAQAILILGAGRYGRAPEYGGATLDELSLMRVRYGAYLHRATGLPVYVSGGRIGYDDVPLGRLMARVLAEDYGIHVAGVEDRSLTTWENAELSAAMLKADSIGKVLLVTSAWHMPRAMDTFAHFQVQVSAAPTGFVSRPIPADTAGLTDYLPSMKALRESYYAIHEYLGRAWYQVQDTGAKAEPRPALQG